jgi:REP element-mobilizing transposase RayT
MNHPFGWYSRGYLPHFDPGASLQFVTYRLADALPADVVATLQAAESKDAKHSEHIDGVLDRGYGSCVLRGEHADLVIENWRHFDGRDYRLHAFVVMPNHVHILVDIVGSMNLSRIVQRWKSFTSKQLLARATVRAAFPDRRLWQPEYWDRFIRNEAHYRATVDYIAQNPVKAGLTPTAQAWPWSHAFVQ